MGLAGPVPRANTPRGQASGKLSVTRHPVLGHNRATTRPDRRSEPGFAPGQSRMRISEPEPWNRAM